MENDNGFIILSRKFFSDTMWNEARTFSGCEAWLDLIQSARFDATPRKVCIGGREVICCRGQYPASIRFLSKRWQWTEKKVRSFIGHLKKEGKITVECTQGVNIITLCKYEEYNPLGTTKGTPTELSINDFRHERAQPRAHPPEKGHTEGTNTKKGDNYKESPNGDKKNKEIDLSFVDEDFRDVFMEWLEYKRERKEKYKSEKSLKACYNRLVTLSGNDCNKARLVVEQSIACNYAGLFELKNYGTRSITNNIYEQKRTDSERRKSNLMAEFAEADAKFLAEQEAKRKTTGTAGEIPYTLTDGG